MVERKALETTIGPKLEAPPRQSMDAILAAYIDGYSRLTQVDEERILMTLPRHRAIIDVLIEAAEGQKFGTASSQNSRA